MTESIRFSYDTVRESQRRAIFVVRVEDALLEPMEVDEATDRMREKLASRGELTADVVAGQGTLCPTAIRTRSALYGPRCSTRP